MAVGAVLRPVLRPAPRRREHRRAGAAVDGRGGGCCVRRFGGVKTDALGRLVRPALA
jgi:hypothetical protein